MNDYNKIKKIFYRGLHYLLDFLQVAVVFSTYALAISSAVLLTFSPFVIWHFIGKYW